MTRPDVTSTYPPSMAVLVAGAVHPVQPANVNFDRCDRVVADMFGKSGRRPTVRVVEGVACAGPLKPPPLADGQTHLALIVVKRAATSIINRNIRATQEPE